MCVCALLCGQWYVCVRVRVRVPLCGQRVCARARASLCARHFETKGAMFLLD